MGFWSNRQIAGSGVNAQSSRLAIRALNLYASADVLSGGVGEDPTSRRFAYLARNEGTLGER
jgi:hypothetical protein